MSNPFKLILVSAFHEQGGNVLHRHLDGHPQMFVYPFESQLATPQSNSLIDESFVPNRYRYPEFLTDVQPEQAYQAIWDQELKTYLRTPHLSKFKDCGIIMDEKKRIEAFKTCFGYTYVGNTDILNHPELQLSWKRSVGHCSEARARYVEAFFRSTFFAWENLNRSGKETHYVGYSPPIGMEADKIFSDFPDAQIVHIVRNPWSGFADTIKRPFPYSLEKYCQIWNTVQHAAVIYQDKYKGKFKIVRYEDLVLYPKQIMDVLCLSLSLPTSDKTYYPSFNGKKLESVKPWGTIVNATPEANYATANELTAEQKAAIATECKVMLSAFGYSNYLDEGKMPGMQS